MILYSVTHMRGLFDIPSCKGLIEILLYEAHERLIDIILCAMCMGHAKIILHYILYQMIYEYFIFMG